jgi:hypothetical protein
VLLRSHDLTSIAIFDLSCLEVSFGLLGKMAGEHFGDIAKLRYAVAVGVSDALDAVGE